MRVQPLGQSDVRVSAVSFGAYAIGGWYWGVRDAEDDAVGALVAAFEAGIRSVDTAPVYGFGRSEELVGRARKALGSAGDEFAVLTKVGLRWDDDRGKFGFDASDGQGNKLKVYRNGRPDSIALEIDRSLARLGTEVIDVAQVHTPDPTTPIADTMGALAEAVEAGKVRAIGVSNYSGAQIAEAARALDGRAPLASTQSLFNALDRTIESEVLPAAQADGIGVIAYSPLDQGLLTGKVGPERVFPKSDGRHRRVSFLPRNRARVNACLQGVVAPIAKANGLTIAQVMIAWSIAQPGITTALVGARDSVQARENALAGEANLALDDLRTIGEAFANLRIERPAPTLTDRLRGWMHRLRYGA